MFTIGEFSRLGRVSARMLRHYDIIGLLRPAHKDSETGYRYYTSAQLASLNQIEELKGYGFTLAEIKELLPLPAPLLAQRIHARRLKAYDELNRLRKTLRRMEAEIMKMEGNSLALEKYHVITMLDPEQRVFGIRKTINIGQMTELFEELLKEMEKRGLKRAGATQLLYHGEEFSYDNMDVEAQVQVAGEGSEVKIKPACTCVATTHAGPYETVKYAYEALGAWMSEHPEYQVAGPAIERYLKDEGMVQSPEEMETGVLFPVVEKTKP